MSSSPNQSPQYRRSSKGCTSSSRTRIPKVRDTGPKVQSSNPADDDDQNASLAVKREARRLFTVPMANLLRAEQTVKGWGKGGWRIIHVLSGMPVTTRDSFVYDNGTKYGYFRTKRAANRAIDALLESNIDWSQGVEYFAGKRALVQAIFDNLFEAGSVS